MYLVLDDLARKIGLYLELGQSVVLIRDRQKDIDVLLDSVLDNNKNMYQFIKIDMSKLSTHLELSELIVSETYNILDDKNILDDFYDKEDDYRYLSYALELPETIAKQIGINIVFVINHLEAAINLDTDIKTMEMMRSFFQHQHNVIHIFTSTSDALMKNVFSNRNNPFFRFSDIIY